MENEKKKNIGLLIIMIIVAMLFAVGGWILGKNSANIENKQDNQKIEEKDKQQENNQTKDTTPTKIEGTTNEEIEALGKNMFDKVSFNDGWMIFGHYPFIDDNRNINTIDNTFTDEVVLLSLFKSDSTHDSTYNETECRNSSFYENTTLEPESSCLIKRISKEIFSNEYYKFFGRIPNTFTNEISITCDTSCILSNDEYKCYATAGGCGDDAACYGGYKYVSSKIVNNELIVNIESYVENCSEDVNPVEYNNTFGGKYTVTFKQNANNDWYWYSTQAK